MLTFGHRLNMNFHMNNPWHTPTMRLYPQVVALSVDVSIVLTNPIPCCLASSKEQGMTFMPHYLPSLTIEAVP